MAGTLLDLHEPHGERRQEVPAEIFGFELLTQDVGAAGCVGVERGRVARGAVVQPLHVDAEGDCVHIGKLVGTGPGGREHQGLSTKGTLEVLEWHGYVKILDAGQVEVVAARCGTVCQLAGVWV